MAWPNHRLTVTIAASFVVFAAIDVVDRDFGWALWSKLALLVCLVGLALQEKRRGD